MNYIWIVNICAGIGIILIVHFVYLFILSKRSKNWKTTEGVVIGSKMREILDEGSSYYTDIQYRYVIEEEEYCSNRVFYGNNIGKNLPFSSKALVNKYVKGKKVIVYYNPRNPNESVLETGVHAVVYRALFTGILFLLLSVIMFFNEELFVSFFSNG